MSLPSYYPIMGQRVIEVINYDPKYGTYAVTIEDQPSGIKLRFGPGELDKILKIVDDQLRQFKKTFEFMEK